MQRILRTALPLGVGFLAISLLWVVYNSYVPIMLKSFGLTSFLVGLIMTLDNILAVSWGPLVGSLSDRTVTSWGKRIPYLLVALPFTTLFFALIPHISSLSLILFVVLLFFLNLAIATVRTPVVALAPDLLPPEDRSKAVGITNFLGGIGAIVGYLIFPILYGINHSLPFYLTSLVVILSGLVILLFIKEKPGHHLPQEEKPFWLDTLNFLRDTFIFTDKQLSYLFLAIFTYFLGYNALETFFTSYGKFELNLKPQEAAFLLGLFALSFFLFSIPAGFLGASLGNKKIALIGLTTLSLIMLILFYLTKIDIPFARLLLFIRVLLILGGISWSLVNVNVFPLVVNLVSAEKTGMASGYYYFFSMSAAIISPPIIGLIIDKTSHSIIFLMAFLFLIGGVLLMKQISVK